MRIITTPKELMDAGVWDSACDVLGYNPYAVNEGLPSDHEITISADQAIEIGLQLIPSKPKILTDWQ